MQACTHTDTQARTHAQVSTPSAIGVAPPVSPVRADSPDVTLSKHMPGSTPMTPDVRLWHRAVVVHQ
eukprot:172561-Pelagomonas_calceolata.AAC.1